MQTTLTFIRHGQTDWNAAGIVQGAADVPLNATGIEQAYRKAPFFKDEQYDLAFSSPLTRAKQTLAIICATNNFSCEQICDPRLVERTFGHAEGHHVHLIRSMRVSMQEPIGFETDAVLEARVFDFMEECRVKSARKNIIITAHSHVLKAALIAVDSDTFSYQTALDNLAIITIIYDHALEKWFISNAEIGISIDRIKI
ncbi:phosphoglycerate mutase [Erysipelotrichaceae bacterium]|nr:phosphoglycerate mutase [Erysipelotrichaceae bacterium]